MPSGGGGGGSSTQTVQNYSPAEAARREAVQKAAEDLYGSTKAKITSSPYPGAQPVPFSNSTLVGQQLAQTAGNTAATAYIPELTKATQFGLNGALDVNSNPYLQSAIAASIRPITESYTDPGGVMSQIRTNAMNNGGQGTSTRQGIAEGVAAGRYANAIGDTAGKIASEGYGQGLDTFSKVLGLTPQTMSTLSMPASLYGAVGAQQENLGAQKEQYNSDARFWDLNKDWMPVQNWANIVYGGSSPGTTSTTSGGGGCSCAGATPGEAFSVPPALGEG